LFRIIGDDLSRFDPFHRLSPWSDKPTIRKVEDQNEAGDGDRGGILLAAALSSPAWAGHGHGKGGGESMAGGLPALEDRVDAQDL
jgi:hypothetical protein